MAPRTLTSRLRAALAALAMLAASPALAQGWAGGPVAAFVLPAPGTVHVADTRRGLNVRAGPGTAFPRIGTLARGQGGRIAGCNETGRWCAMVFPNGGEGWVYMPLTRPAVAPASLGPAARPGPPVDWRRLYRSDVPYIHTGTGRVNLRQGAGTHRIVVAKLHPGQGGFVQGCSEDARWCLLTIPPHGVEGWVYMPLLDPITGGGTVYHR